MLPLALLLPPSRPLILAHLMPWFAAPPVSREFGWHWTMGKTDPKRQLATHYRPLIGAYDSGDPDLVECQIQLMKLAGIDGALVDWYGNLDHWDYLFNHRNTELALSTLKRAKMKFAAVYEDQTVPPLIKGGKFAESEAVSEGAKLMQWVDENWFSDPAYLKVDGKPVFLVFGPQYYRDNDWPKMFAGLKQPPAFYTLHHRREPAYSSYDWPLPQGGKPAAEAKRREFLARNEGPNSIPVAFPRFHDYYRAAGLDYGYDEVIDDDGKTFRTSLQEAIAAKTPFVQVATWNDWGEGTQIEPSVEFGYRDLEEIQRQRRKLGPFPFTKADLRLPIQLYRMRKKQPGNPKLSKASAALLAGNPSLARTLMKG